MGFRLSDLALLQEATREKQEAEGRWNAAIELAIRSGQFSERQIGDAAGITGVAVHHRKQKVKAHA